MNHAGYHRIQGGSTGQTLDLGILEAVKGEAGLPAFLLTTTHDVRVRATGTTKIFGV